MRDHPTPSLTRARAFAALAVLAPALGGSTELWARGTLLLATAAVLLAWPPRRTPGGLWLGLGLGLIALACAAFLPARWFAPPVWRQLLTGTFEVPLPGTMSAQPWLSAEGLGMLAAGVVFAGALLTQAWEREERHAAARTYALGILLLAGLAVGALFAKWHVPWWPRPQNSGIGFGFFPNRNQTANVLAVAGIVITALGFESLGRRHRSGAGWFAGLALIGAALVIAYSRAGIALFFAGTAVWVALALRFSSSRKGATLGFAAVLVMLAGFFLFGGETLKRFQGAAGTPTADYRVGIQEDAWRLAGTQPWLGVGLGNFEPIFALARRAEAEKQNRCVHPESDWLWAAVELGWPAVALLALALGLWAAETLPFAPKTDRQVRSAAAVGAVAFALHGLVDVSGHRAGALWPALLLFSLARHPGRARAERGWVGPVFRGAAGALAALGAWWVISARWPEKTLHFPTSGTLAWLEARLERENTAADYSAVEATANEALRIAPLSWQIYYRRAVAHAGTPGGVPAAAADFDTARFLEPRWALLCLNEGKVWLALDEPQLTIEAWAEALRRAGADAPGYYEQMLTAGGKKLGVRAGLAQLAQSHPNLLNAYLERTGGLDFALMAERFLERDPTLASLSGPQRRGFFGTWFRNGDRARLIALMVAHPEWQEEAWPWLARHYAEKQDYERAWRFVERYGPVPALPKIVTGHSLAELERGFHLHPDDVQAGLALYTALRKLRQNDEALATLRAVSGIAGRPNYVPYLEAMLWAEKEEWGKAWEAWGRYFATVK